MSSALRTVPVLNSTAYRIFKLLLWLMEEPLSVEQLNNKMQSDPLIEKTVSQDSIWLYLNTLRLLGCDISRPTRANGFKHTLNAHPFGFVLTDQDIELLTQVKLHADEYFDHEALRLFESALLTLLSHVASHEKEHRLEAFWQTTGLSPMQHHLPDETLLKQFDQWVQHQALLSITYDSPVEGKETLEVLVHQLNYRRGLYYLQVLRLDRRETLSQLRVDRILECVELENCEVLRGELQLSLKESQVIRLVVPDLLLHEWPDLGIPQEVAYLEPASMEPKGLQVTLYTQDWFRTCQQLLAHGVAVRVESPSAFHDLYKQTLLDTLQHYEENHSW